MALRAPFAGTVTALRLNTGEMALPGQVALTLADLSRLQVETTDLSRRNVDRVAVGQPVSVFVEALGAGSVASHGSHLRQRWRAAIRSMLS